MRIIDNAIICIRTTSEQHDYFEQQTGINEFPKRQIFTMIPETLFAGFHEPRIVPQLRMKNLGDVACWATHTAILETFLQTSKHEWLFVIEDTVEFSAWQIQQIEAVVNSGFNKLEQFSHAYVIDRNTAQIVVKNAQIYYTPFHLYIDDLKALGLVDVHDVPVLKVLAYPFLYNYFPLFFIVFCLLLFFSPLYRILSQQFVGFTEVFGAEETSVG